MADRIYDILTEVARLGALITEADLARGIERDPISEGTDTYLRGALEERVRLDVAVQRPLVALLVRVRDTDAPVVYMRRLCAHAGIFDHPLGDSEAWAAFVQEERQQVYNYYQRRR